LALALLSALILMVSRSAHAQTETTLYSFCTTGGESCTDGAHPTSRLTFDGKGNLFGTTSYGGQGYGTVFELSPNGNSGWNETVLYTFTGGADGANPYLSYVLFDKVGNIYGTASNGGAYGYGVVFELSPVGASWTETVLYSFAGGADGAAPENGLVMDSKGNLYGVTASGGSLYGTVFELSQSGDGWKEEVIYNLYSDGAGLIMDATGNIFGASAWTVFELSPNGSGGWNPTVIYTFKAQFGQSPNPQGTLVFDSAGNLYGTTAGNLNTAYGKVYKLSPSESGQWTYQTIYNFEGDDCSRYQAGVVLDAAGNIYGTGACGGPDFTGTVFGLSGPPDSTGKYQERFNWTFDGADGADPMGSLILDSAGHLYGTTSTGGPLGDGSGGGVVFEVIPPPTVTTTALASSLNPSTYGEAVTFTALVTSSLGAPPDGESGFAYESENSVGNGDTERRLGRVHNLDIARGQ
jgi:uncharacterized repeat protein (TIGR03803 family)